MTGLFLGYYLPWDGLSNALIAQANGFTTLPQAVEGSMVNYENLDNHQTGIHDYFKFLKFGFSARHRHRLPAHPPRAASRGRTRWRSCSSATASSRGRTSASRSEDILGRST